LGASGTLLAQMSPWTETLYIVICFVLVELLIIFIWVDNHTPGISVGHFTTTSGITGRQPITAKQNNRAKACIAFFM